MTHVADALVPQSHDRKSEPGHVRGLDDPAGGGSRSSRGAWVRPVHRWVSMLFTATVLANFATMAVVQGAPPPWITYSPLPPLAFLLATGLWLFALPYVRRRSAR